MTGRLTVLTVAFGLTVSAEDRAASLASVQVLAIRKAADLTARDLTGSVAYVSVGRRSRDPSAALLAALADGTHEFKPQSSCPRQNTSLGEFCVPEAGAVELFVGEVTFLDEDLAEADLGYRLGPSSGPTCTHRFKREAGKWRVASETEFRARCKIH